MRYELENGKFVNIPEKDIEYLMNKYKLTKDWAIYAWLVDEEYITDPTVEKLEKKAKENKISRDARAIKPKTERKAREKKENPLKKEIIEIIFTVLQNKLIEHEDFSYINVTNKEKYVDFAIGNRTFTINLIEHRGKKNEFIDK